MSNRVSLSSQGYSIVCWVLSRFSVSDADVFSLRYTNFYAVSGLCSTVFGGQLLPPSVLKFSGLGHFEKSLETVS